MTKNLEKEKELQQQTVEGSEPQPKTDAEAVAEDKHPLSAFRLRLSARYPDCGADWTDWQTVEAYAEKMANELAEQLEQYRDAEGRLTALMAEHPELKNMIVDMLDNASSPLDAFNGAFRPEFVAEQTKMDHEFNDHCIRLDHNLTESEQVFDKFCRELQLPESLQAALVETINADWNALLEKRVTDEMLRGYLKRLCYDEDLKYAKMSGEIAGRNLSIKEQMEAEGRNQTGDGLPTHNGGGYAPRMLSGNRPVIDFDRLMR